MLSAKLKVLFIGAVLVVGCGEISSSDEGNDTTAAGGAVYGMGGGIVEGCGFYSPYDCIPGCPCIPGAGGVTFKSCPAGILGSCYPDCPNYNPSDPSCSPSTGGTNSGGAGILTPGIGGGFNVDSICGPLLQMEIGGAAGGPANSCVEACAYCEHSSECCAATTGQICADNRCVDL